MVSVLIPTYNEAVDISRTLNCLAQVRGCIEVIVIDGESSDATCAIVEALISEFPHPLRLLRCERCRALQLNLGAELAVGEVLLFLHADARLAHGAVAAIEQALVPREIVGGNFRLLFEGENVWSRFFTWANEVRRRFGIYYGDSGIFVRRVVFERLGGFRTIPIMDDYEFVRRLERLGRTAYLREVVQVSDRRWRIQGVFRTLLSWIWIQGLYSLGIPAGRLARWYHPVRGPTIESHDISDGDAMSPALVSNHHDEERPPLTS